MMNRQKVMTQLLSALLRAGRDAGRARRAVNETRAWLLAQAGTEPWSPELRLHLDDEFRSLLESAERRAAELEEYEWAGALLGTANEIESHGS